MFGKLTVAFRNIPQNSSVDYLTSPKTFRNNFQIFLLIFVTLGNLPGFHLQITLKQKKQQIGRIIR
jgi:hypothetical protein